MMGSEFIKLKLVFLFHVFSQKKEKIILLQNKRFRINLFRIPKTLLSDTIFQMSTGAHRRYLQVRKIQTIHLPHNRPQFFRCLLHSVISWKYSLLTITRRRQVTISAPLLAP